MAITLVRRLLLPCATVEVHAWGVKTIFPDGTEVVAAPQDNDEYRARAIELGYGNDALAMCVDHEVLHSVAAELLHRSPSEVLWRVAHGDESKLGLGAEEHLILRLQTELRR